MVHDLVVRRRSPRTQEAYLAAVAGLAKHSHHRPDALSAQQVEGYIRHLIEQRRLAPHRVRRAVFGLRVFSTVTLKRPTFALPLPKGETKLPEVLSREGVGRLQVSDLDALQDLLRVEQGTGRKDRYPLLGTGIKLRIDPALRLRRCRGYAQHERQMVHDFPPPVRPERSGAQSKGRVPPETVLT